MNKKTAPHGLGRGLGALLGEIETENEALTSQEVGSGDIVTELPLSEIDINRAQPRKVFDEEKLRELSESIASVGVIQPIVVCRRGDRYSIIVGERRFRASRMAGKTTIPAIVRDWDEMTRLKTALIENLQRSDLNPVETALGIKTLMEKCDLTQEEASSVVGMSRSALANTLRLLTLDEKVLKMLEDGTLSAGHARALVTLSPERQVRLATLCIQQGWNVRQLERIAALPEEPAVKPAVPKSPEIKKLEKMAREAFGTHAKIDGDENKGRLILSYTSAEDLERIWDVLSYMNQAEV